VNQVGSSFNTICFLSGDFNDLEEGGFNFLSNYRAIFST
jgi:hypothetical protein